MWRSPTKARIPVPSIRQQSFRSVPPSLSAWCRQLWNGFPCGKSQSLAVPVHSGTTSAAWQAGMPSRAIPMPLQAERVPSRYIIPAQSGKTSQWTQLEKTVGESWTNRLQLLKRQCSRLKRTWYRWIPPTWYPSGNRVLLCHKSVGKSGYRRIESQWWARSASRRTQVFQPQD